MFVFLHILSLVDLFWSTHSFCKVYMKTCWSWNKHGGGQLNSLPAACLVISWDKAIKWEHFDRRMFLSVKVKASGLPLIYIKKHVSKCFPIVIAPLIRLDAIGFNNWDAGWLTWSLLFITFLSHSSKPSSHPLFTHSVIFLPGGGKFCSFVSLFVLHCFIVLTKLNQISALWRF